MSLERIFSVRPAYDCLMVQPCVHGSKTCKPDTGGSHGRHNAELHMTVRGPEAEIILVIGTGWDLPVTPNDMRVNRIIDCPKGVFVQFHTARPRHEWQKEADEPQHGAACEGWTQCYTDTGYLIAEAPAVLLVEKGSEAVWEWLEALHDSTVTDMDTLADAQSPEAVN